MIFMISIVFINIPKDSILLFQTKLIFDGILPIHVRTNLRHIGEYVIILYHPLVSYKEKKQANWSFINAFTFKIWKDFFSRLNVDVLIFPESKWWKYTARTCKRFFSFRKIGRKPFKIFLMSQKRIFPISLKEENQS